jgi:hypothetical protein
MSLENGEIDMVSQSQPVTEHVAEATATASAQPSVAFTPGPWVAFDRATVSNIYTTGNDGSLLAQAHSYDAYISDKRPGRAERLANARLIASAPELYEALKAAARTFRMYEELHREKGTVEGAQRAAANGSMARRCEDALAKAEGRS